MRVVAAIPASALLAGAAFGLHVPDPHFVVAYVLLSSSIAGAMFGWALRSRPLLIASIALGFFTGGWLLSSVEWQRAWRPSLRVRFEELARAERAAAAAQGRRLPEDDEAFAIVEGVLHADAAPTENGVSLSVLVDTLLRPVPQKVRLKPDPTEVSFAPAASGFSETPVASGLTETPVVSGFSRTSASGGILVTVIGSLAAERLTDWRAGRRVRVPAQLRRPSRYLNPGVPDQERALARRGTTLVGTVKSGALVEVVARASPVAEAMAAARGFARAAIDDAVGRWSPQSAAIVRAIVIGDRAGLDEEVQRRLQEAGTYHVIAISGGNIAILAGLILGAFRRAGLLGRTAMLSAIALLIVYAVFVGGGASVDRATLMAVVYFGARAFDQRSPPLNALALVSALLVATSPLSIADPAFLLTFGATLAIVIVVPIVTSWNQKLSRTDPHEGTKDHEAHPSTSSGRARVVSLSNHVFLRAASWLREKPSTVSPLFAAIRRPLVAMFAASAAAEAMLFPVTAAAFSRVTFAGLALNFLAIPLMGAAQIAGMLIVPAAIVSDVLARVVGGVAHLGAAGLVWSADFVRFVPVLSYRVAPAAWVVIIIYYAAVIAWWITPPRPRFSATVLRTIAIASAIWILFDPRTLIAARGDGRLHVTFLDVGQGDASFVRFPHGSTLLVDTGGLAFSSRFDIGDRVVAPMMRDAGFRRLNVLALTHGDPDHIGGAASILEEFRPREVWEGIPVPRLESLTTLRLQAQAAGSRWANVYAGDRTVIDEVAVIAWHPDEADWERQKVRNDDSLVLELRWRDVSVLLTGDIGGAVERRLATTLQPAPLRVVKIPHHGSLTSSSPEFVRAIRANIAVASAGRGNHFGHPVPEVLERYRATGAEIFRTDRDGAVTVDTDGTSLNVHTFTNRYFRVSATTAHHEDTKTTKDTKPCPPSFALNAATRSRSFGGTDDWCASRRAPRAWFWTQ